MKLDKISMKEADKMVRSGEYHILHIDWDRDLEQEHPDCTHFLVDVHKYWRKDKDYAALVQATERESEVHRKYFSKSDIDPIMLPLESMRMRNRTHERVFPIAFFTAEEVNVDPNNVKPSTALADYCEERKWEYPDCSCDYHTPKYILSATYGQGVGYHWHRVCNVCKNMAVDTMSERECDNVQITREDGIIMPLDKYEKLLRANIIYDKLH